MITRNLIRRQLMTFLGTVMVGHVALAAEGLAQSHPPFEGKIGLTAKESIPSWPDPVKAPQDAPSIVVILLDDIGFADTSAFGGVSPTPELDKLAAQGLRYNNFHTTAMCSPTRAALLTGRNHHRVGFGAIADAAGGYPGYNSVWKKSTASVAEILRQNGYSTSAFGKWHNTPDWEITPAGPFDRWPTGLGFEHFYGFMGPDGADNHWEPSKLYRNTTPIEPPATPQQGYHLTTDIANEAIKWVQTHESLAPDKPYFLYFATGAVHIPDHAPKEWIDRYRGKFDAGWDKLRQEIFVRQKKLGVVPAAARLTPRPGEIPAWNSLSADQKRLFARQMEVYAGFVAHTDFEIGRLLKAVRTMPSGENTLVLYIVGDNGGDGHSLNGRTEFITSIEGQLKYLDELGSPLHPFNYHAAGWAWMGSTPFQWWKMFASHFGGVRNPLIVSWPERINDRGGLRSQFTHVNDVASTIYEAAGIDFPSRVNGVEQQPLDGVSFAYSFNHAKEPSRHKTQYFELFGNRAIYHDGWVAAARHMTPFVWGGSNNNYEDDRWELYRVSEDFSQADDLAAEHPGKLRELQKLFDSEARKNDVYPLGGAMAGLEAKPSLTANKRQYVFFPGMARIPVAAMPPLIGKSYRITADVTISGPDAQGVILSSGGAEGGTMDGGFAFYIKDGRLVYEHNLLLGNANEIISSGTPLSRGRSVVAFEYIQEKSEKINDWQIQSSGVGRLLIDDKLVGEGRLTGAQRGPRSMGVGQAFGAPISEAFQPPFKFTGALEKVTVEIQ